jgi:uncharacterized protein YbaA (DUF1428 family)
MVPGSMRKPLVMPFQRSRVEECFSLHKRAAPAGRIPIWNRVNVKTTQGEDSVSSWRTYPAEVCRRNQHRRNLAEARVCNRHNISADGNEHWRAYRRYSRNSNFGEAFTCRVSKGVSKIEPPRRPFETAKTLE